MKKNSRSDEQSEVSDFEDVAVHLDSYGKDPTFENLETRKLQIEGILTILIRENRELKRIMHSIRANEDRFEFEKTNVETAKNNLEHIVNIDPIKKCEEIRQLDHRLADAEKNFCEVSERIVKEKEEVLTKSVNHFQQLKKLKKIFFNEHLNVIEKLECYKARVDTSKIAKIQEKINFLKGHFQQELDSITNFETKLDQLDLSEENSNSSDEDSALSIKSHFSVEENICFKKTPVKSNDQTYIQKHLGKALVDGLAAMHLFQPIDPVYFLAHFLSHFRHNELLHIEKQNSFEDLVKKRKEMVNYIEESACRKIECSHCQRDFNKKKL